MNMRPALALTLLTLTSGISLSAHAQSADNADDGFIATFGVERSASILSGGKDAKPEVGALAGLEYRSGRFFASTSQGIGYDIWKTEDFTVFGAVGYQGGRKASKRGDSKDNQRLVGMGDIKSSGILAGGVVAQPFGDIVQFQAILLKSTRKEQGLTAVFGASAGFPVWGPVSGFVGVDATYADRKHAQTFFGVTPVQAARSGNPVFSPKAGLLGSSVSVGLNWEINQQWSATASVAREQLLGDAKKSPLFTRKSDTTASVSVSYKF